METEYAGARTGWVGWISFAALLMIVAGALGAMAGLAAIVRDETYVQVAGRVWIFDETAWGWIHLLLGIAIVAVGAMMLQGRPIALGLGAGIIMLHMLGSFAWLSIYPWWGMVVIAIDILILYAIVVHGYEAVRS
jgi:hypothetical protein